MHYLTLNELRRIVHTTPGNEALADLLDQIVDDPGAPNAVLRVDLDKLLRKPDDNVGSLPHK